MDSHRLRSPPAGGFHTVDLLDKTGNGIPIAGDTGVTPYLIPTAIAVLFAVFTGRRGMCHSVCPIAVIARTGRKIRTSVHRPPLRREPEKDRCIDGRTCSRGCPMSPDANGMVRKAQMEQTGCILCGSCVDICPDGAISYAWTPGTRVQS